MTNDGSRGAGLSRRSLPLAVLACLGLGLSPQHEPVPPDIKTVEIRDRVFLVNGKPFLPIFSWLQDPGNFARVRECGMNATAGYWSGSGGTKDVTEYLGLVEKAGLAGVMPFDPRLKGRPGLLGYIHDDEPDLPHQVSDATVEPSKELKINRRTPLWKILDGELTSWSVLDPLEGARFTLKLPKPVTVQSLAVAVTVSKGLSLPKEVAFEAGGAELLKAALEPKPGRQKFALPSPATFQELTVKVRSVTKGDQEWGSIGEIEGFDAKDQNLLLSPPRQVPRAMPAETAKKYAEVKAADPGRPVFLTLTGNFHPHFKKWTEEQMGLYPQYIQAADVVGYDIYPIYGWNKPEWIHLVQEATDRLAKLAGTRPVYAWIETSKGGQWTGALENQKEVTPLHIRAEVWMSLCRGATAIGYFTHVWKPSYSQFGVPEANCKALREINDQVTRLAPAILAAPAPGASIESPGGVKLDLLARQSGQELHLFAVNYDERLKEAAATIRVKGLAAGRKVVVVDENRDLTSIDGAFADTFAPLAVHIYRIGP